MKMKNIVLAASAAVLLAGSANAASTLIGVTDQNRLVTFNSSTPGTFDSDIAITGTSATFLALDIRDSNGLLYGLGDDLTVYTINQLSGLASAVGGPLALTGTNFGFDFNTAVDRLRIVSNSGNNYVINADTGTVQTTAPNVAFAAGDPNAGFAPVVGGNSYIHGTPTQFAISTSRDVLAAQNNMTGALNTIGSLGVNVGPRTSFDIGVDGVGYLAEVDRLYTVNLTTGAATQTGFFSRSVFGITSAVPEPATWMMMLFGFGVIGASMRRRQRLPGTKLNFA